MKWLIYKENPALPKDLRVDLVATFEEKTDAEEYLAFLQKKEKSELEYYMKEKGTRS